jgi:DNA-3-methyladenine glycosylase I
MPKLKKGLVQGEDGLVRCWWGASTPDYAAYHDEEWGFAVHDDVRLFEKICLEGFQSGLSWLTILRKRENFRKAFAGFDYHRVARFNQRSVDRLLGDAGIVRHRGKIESTINNAKRAVELEDEFGSLSAFFWEWVPPKRERPRTMNQASLMKLAKTPTSTALSKELKGRGWSFVGPTTAYAFMQAMGLVNDHLEGCFVRERIAKSQRA